MTEQTGPSAVSGTLPPEEQVAGSRGVAWGQIIVWGIIIGLVGLLGWQLINRNQAQPMEGRAPDFTLTTFDGEEIRLSDLRGQVVVINFWASWCVPCAEEAPELEATWQAYKDQGVVLIGIDYVDTEREALAFIEEYGITYPNGPDRGERISDAYRITGVPETFVIDPEGNITFFVAAPINRAILGREIERAMQSGSGD